MHPCVHCLLGFETLEMIEFRNREGAGPGDARHGLGPHVRERGLPGVDEARLRDLRREAVPKEVDSIAKRGSELVYIQVSDDISFESTLERELAPLLSVRDAFPKVLIARTRYEPYTREGVLVLDLARWLLGEQGF